MNNKLNREELLLLDKLLAELSTGNLSPEDAANLKKLVVSNPSALWRYIQATQLIAGLWWEKGGVANSPAELNQDDAIRGNSEQRPFIGSLPPFRAAQGFYTRHLRLSRVAAFLILGTTALWATGNIQLFTTKQVKIADVPAYSLNQVAQIISISPDCQWATDNGQLSDGQSLESGQEIRLNSGSVCLGFDQGARVELSGPAAFVVKTANSGDLILGGLTAQVPQNAYGFCVGTPHGKVLDQGTEFGVVVDDFGSTEVGVFKGKVLAQARQDEGPVELIAGTALLWDSGSATYSPVSQQRYYRGLAYSSFVNEETLSAKLVLSEDFDDQELNADQWKTLGHVTEKAGGLQLGRDQGEYQRGNVPYLLTTRQFNPSDGALVITGTVRFSQPLHLHSGALSVFTRAEDRRGVFPRPEYAYLGTGVRSTFWPVSTVAGETLRILLRPLPGADNVGILGEEFDASSSSSDWRFQVVDDGVNLVLSIAQHDNPAIMKTVRARSLFNGVANYIAFEGDPNAAIVLDNIKIYQCEPNLSNLDHVMFHHRSKNTNDFLSCLTPSLAGLHFESFQ